MPRGPQVRSGRSRVAPMMDLESRFDGRGRNKKGMRPDRMTDNERRPSPDLLPRPNDSPPLVMGQPMYVTPLRIEMVRNSNLLS